MREVIDLLRLRPTFAALWAAGLVSLVGDWLSFIAVAMLAVGQAHGALPLAMVLVAHQAPAALLSPLAGTLVDRLDRRQVLLWINIAQAIWTLLAAWFAYQGSLVGVQCMIAVRSATSAFLGPAEMAAVGRLVEPSELTLANTILATTWSLSYVFGMAAGGALAILGPTTALLLDVATFVVAALFVLKLPSITPDRDIPARFAPWAEMREALTDAATRPGLLPAVFIKAPIMIAAGSAWLALHLTVGTAVALGNVGFSIGLLQAARGVGTGVGPWLARSASKRGIRRTTLFAVAGLVAFCGMSLLGVTDSPWLLFAGVFAWGFGSGANFVLASVQIQELAGDARIGRLTSVDELLGQGSMMGTALLTAVCIDAGLRDTRAVWVGLALGVSAFVWSQTQIRRS